MLVTLRVFGSTYDQKRRTFTEHFEYPELPAPVAARYRGFHRYDLTTCIACDQCAKACPVDCIYIGKERVTGGKGFQVSGFTIDYSKCMFCALCVEPCPVDARSELLQSRRNDRRLRPSSRRCGVGTFNAQSHGGRGLESDCRSRARGAQSVGQLGRRRTLTGPGVTGPVPRERGGRSWMRISRASGCVSPPPLRRSPCLRRSLCSVRPLLGSCCLLPRLPGWFPSAGSPVG